MKNDRKEVFGFFSRFIIIAPVCPRKPQCFSTVLEQKSKVAQFGHDSTSRVFVLPHELPFLKFQIPYFRPVFLFIHYFFNYIFFISLSDSIFECLVTIHFHQVELFASVKLKVSSFYEETSPEPPFDIVVAGILIIQLNCFSN